MIKLLWMFCVFLLAYSALSQQILTEDDLTDVATVKEWLATGGNPNIDVEYTNIFLLAIRQEAPLEVITLFLNSGINVNFQGHYPFYLDDGITVKFCTPLAVAIIENQLETAGLLIERGANISEGEANLQTQCIADDYFAYPEVLLKGSRNYREI
jgi:hypothetical protein